jgi:hypothetical protein
MSVLCILSVHLPLEKIEQECVPVLGPRLELLKNSESRRVDRHARNRVDGRHGMAQDIIVLMIFTNIEIASFRPLGPMPRKPARPQLAASQERSLLKVVLRRGAARP